MNVSTHDISLETLDTLTEVDSLCLFIGEDERPLSGIAGFFDWRLCGGLSRVLRQRFFTGAQGDRLLLPTDGRVAMGRVFAVGLGKAASLSVEALGEALAGAARMLNKANVQGVALELPGEGRLDDAVRAEAFSQRFRPEFKGARVALLAEKPLRMRLPKVAGAQGR
ncbi:MAG: M17 family peptidase N-terminal domain-containing protein [Myxococcota bacterium]